MGWFKRKPKIPKTSEQLEAERKWREKVDEIFENADRENKKGRKCPTCNGTGQSFLNVACGLCGCMTCGGTGRIS